MKVALIHYHLRQGGVAHTINDLIGVPGIDFCILTGEPPDAPYDVPVEVVPLLAYDERRAHTGSPDALYQEIRGAVHRVWPRSDCLLHLLNPVLGRNSLFPGLLQHFDRARRNVLYHILDFAEDGRYANLPNVAYPEHGHFAVSTSRDADVLRFAGAAPPGVHVFPLAKAQSIPSISPHSSSGGDLYLMPVRARARKNIGEALLLCALFEGKRRIQITLAPESAGDLQLYGQWKALAGKLALPVSFEAGISRPIEELYAESTAALTCSVREGYGYAFVDPWICGRAVLGRDIPSITADLKQHGLHLELYRQLKVPCTSAGIDRIRALLLSRARQAFVALGSSLPSAVRSRIEESLTEADTVDFAKMPPAMQRCLLQECASSLELKSEIVALNPRLTSFDHVSTDGETCERNRDILTTVFGPWHYARRVRALYNAASVPSPAHHIRSSPIMERFHSPDLLFPH